MNGLVRRSMLVGDDEAGIGEVVASCRGHAASVLLRRLRARIERHPARPRHVQTACGAAHRLPP